MSSNPLNGLFIIRSDVTPNRVIGETTPTGDPSLFPISMLAAESEPLIWTIRSINGQVHNLTPALSAFQTTVQDGKLYSTPPTSQHGQANWVLQSISGDRYRIVSESWDKCWTTTGAAGNQITVEAPVPPLQESFDSKTFTIKRPVGLKVLL